MFCESGALNEAGQLFVKTIGVPLFAVLSALAADIHPNDFSNTVRRREEALKMDVSEPSLVPIGSDIPRRKNILIQRNIKGNLRPRL